MNLADSIIKLNELLEKGGISQSEYEILKSELLNQTNNIKESKVDLNSNSNNKKKRTLLFGISAILISIFVYFFLLPKEKVAVPFLKLNGKYCVVDTISMQPIDTNEFEDCRILPNGFILCNSNSKYGLYSKQGKKITELIYTEISNFENGFSVITKEKLQGVIDINGNEIVTPKYESIKILSGDFFAVSKNNKWGYCNEAGKEIIEPKFDEVGKFSEGLAIVKEDNSFGYINKEGLLVIPTQFQVGYGFCNGRALVQKNNGEICVIDNKGELIQNIVTADYISDLSEGIFEIKRNSRGIRKSALIDSSGRLLTDFEYYNNQEGVGCTMPFKNGYAAICKGDFWGVVDKNGKEIIKPKYTNMLFFNEGIASFKRDGIKRLTEGEGVVYYDYFGGKNGIVKLNGEEIQTKNYDGFGFFSEGLVDVSKNNKLGYIDTSGIEVIDLKYDYVSEFSEGLSIVSKNNLCVYIDKRGNEVIDNKYDLDEMTYEEEGVKLFKSECSFKNGFARVSIKENNKNLIFYIDRSGREFREKFDKNNTEIQAINSENLNKIEFTNLEIEDNLMLLCLEKKMANKYSEQLYENPKIIGRKTYLQNNKAYILLVLGFKDKNPNACHGCHGFTDLALLEYENGNYLPIDYFENASQGIYGDYGQLIDFFLFGESHLSVGLGYYDEGQGAQYNNVNVLGVIDKKIKLISQFYDAERQIDADGITSKDINREFKFIKSSKQFYDLEINTFDKVINNQTTKTIQFDIQAKEYKLEE